METAQTTRTNHAAGLLRVAHVVAGAVVTLCRVGAVRHVVMAKGGERV